MGEPKFLHGLRGSNRGTLRVAETFVSRQGEGQLTGVESLFIRTSGCNLRCWFCDTPYASWKPEGSSISLGAVLGQAAEAGVRHAVVTGGEPLISPGVPKLCRLLRESKIHVTIETAGTVYADVDCDLMSISPKLRSSTPSSSAHPRWSRLHEARRMPIDTMRQLAKRGEDYQFKFVVVSADDLPETEQLVGELAVEPRHVWIMPQGVTVEALDHAERWLRPWAEARDYRYCDRMQIRWYGNRRGT